jgi:hypothetical protein
MQSIPEKLGIQEEVWKRLIDNAVAELHVCNPGIVQSFDSEKQTVTVVLAIKEKILQNNHTVEDVVFPLLVDVPISVPRAGGFSLTLPIKKGDECLVIFSDLGIDWWYQNGGTQVKTQDLRRHDLSDGFAIMGVWSQPRVIANYNTNAAELRNDKGTAYLRIGEDGQITIKGSQINLNSYVKTNNHLEVSTGASGVFADKAGKTITVKNGVIVGIN